MDRQEPISVDAPLALHIARLMSVGTTVAAALLTLGALLAITGPTRAATPLLAAGCGLLVLLPAARLALMARHFAKLRDSRYTVVALVVLGLVAIGCSIGLAR